MDADVVAAQISRETLPALCAVPFNSRGDARAMRTQSGARGEQSRSINAAEAEHFFFFGRLCQERGYLVVIYNHKAHSLKDPFHFYISAGALSRLARKYTF